MPLPLLMTASMVPIRMIATELGAEVIWENPRVLIRQRAVLKLSIGSNTVLVDGREVLLMRVPEIINGRTFVPLRFVGEALGAVVDYRNAKVLIHSVGAAAFYDATPFYESGDWFYIAGYNNRQVSDSTAYPYAADGDYLYYGGSRLNLVTGQDATINTHISQLIINGGWLYYVKEGTIRRVKNSGTPDANPDISKEELLVSEGALKIYSVSDSGLVYSLWGEKLMYYSFAAAQSTKLMDGQITCISGGYIYALEQVDFAGDDNLSHSHYSIFRMDLDGANKTVIVTEDVDTPFKDFKIHGGWLYYVCNIPEKVAHTDADKYHLDYYSGFLTRVRPDGTDKQLLSAEKVDSFAFYSEGIFCRQFHTEENGLKATDIFIKFSDLY